MRSRLVSFVARRGSVRSDFFPLHDAVLNDRKGMALIRQALLQPKYRVATRLLDV
jgi:hypothetical protein